jgi:hypothetical protein
LSHSDYVPSRHSKKGGDGRNMKETPEISTRSPDKNKDPGAGVGNCGQHAGARGSIFLPADHLSWRVHFTFLCAYQSRAGKGELVLGPATRNRSKRTREGRSK